MRRALAPVVAVSLGGCFFTSTDGSATSSPAPVKSITIAPATTVASSTTTAPSAAPSTASITADPRELTFSFAVYSHDRLDQCIDIKQHFGDDIDALNGRAYLKDSAATKLPAGSTVLAISCKEAFSDRRPLAMCTEDVPVSDDGKKRGLVSALGTSRFYLFETALADDGPMRTCLNEKGKWEAIAHDSEEFKNAERESHLRRAQDFVKQHGGQ